MTKGMSRFQPNSLRFSEGFPPKGGTEELGSTTSKVRHRESRQKLVAWMEAEGLFMCRDSVP